MIHDVSIFWRELPINTHLFTLCLIWNNIPKSWETQVKRTERAGSQIHNSAAITGPLVSNPWEKNFKPCLSSVIPFPTAIPFPPIQFPEADHHRFMDATTLAPCIDSKQQFWGQGRATPSPFPLQPKHWFTDLLKCKIKHHHHSHLFLI